MFFNIKKAVYSVSDCENPVQCRCGSLKSDYAKSLNYVTFFGLPLAVTREANVTQCKSCFTTQRAQDVAQSTFPKLSIGTKLEKYLGWPALLLLACLGMMVYQSMYPDDGDFRFEPKNGDIFIVNYSLLSGEPDQYSHPFRMARLVEHNTKDGTMTLQVSSWSYKKAKNVARDYFIHKDGYDSYFWRQHQTYDDSIVFDPSRVVSVRRRIVNVDIESAHKKTEFKKKFLDFPWLT